MVGLLPPLLLLAAGLLGAWLPVEWTRNLKRPVQAPNYAWLSAGYTLLYTGVAWWLWRKPQAEQVYRRKWLLLVLALLVVLPNLLNIWLRYTAPLSATDPRPLFGRDADMGLFYEYGKALTEGRWPINPQGQFAEYPQLSFPFFWLGVVLSGANRETFYWVFPLIMTVCQLGAATALFGLGRKLGQARSAFLLAAWVAGCPALYIFNFTRFDMAPAALLLGAVYFAVPGDLSGVRGMKVRRRWHSFSALSGLLVALGGLVKWLPAVIWPWLAAAYWRTRNYAALAFFAVASILCGLLLTLPFFFINSDALLYPYRFQGSRHLIGESFWFLVQRTFFDPAQTTPEKPWGEPSKIILGNNKLLVAQLALTGLIFALALWRLWRTDDEREAFPRWLAAGLVGVVVFTLANRIFSPQYMLLLVWAWAAALLLRPANWRSLSLGFILMAIAAGANFEVYLLGVYPDIWMRDSAILFGAAFLLSGWLLWRALRSPAK
ncbi:MAG TPA: hypothetical protein VH186_32430 [Chloroflexia bacterium]|nr:hypothetical protein [Chloroflexia bacterium]